MKTEKIDFVHTGPGTIAGRYLRQFWQPIFKSTYLQAGKAVKVRIMSEDFTLYRGEGGKAFLTEPECPHRLVPLSIGYVTENTIRCRYHGWQFDESGQCIHQPAEPAPFCHKVRLKTYPVEEHLGFIFAYFGEGPPPPFTRWPSADAVIHARDDMSASVALIPCNYFQSAENILDDTHVPFLHSNLPYPGKTSDGSRRTGIPHISAKETVFGLTQFVEHVDKAPDSIDRVTTIHCLMPNQAHMFVPDIEASFMYWYVPVDDTSHLHFLVFLPKAARLRRTDKTGHWYTVGQHSAPLDMSEPIFCVLEGREPTWKGKKLEGDFPNRVRLEDAVPVVGQGPIADRTRERLGQSDAAIILFRKLWVRELTRLAHGETLTAFEREGFAREFDQLMGPIAAV